MLKKLLIVGGVVLVIIVVGIVYLTSNLDSIVKKAIVTLGPQMTGVSVKVSKVGIALTEGRGEIGGLVVGNPKGYKESYAFKLGSIVLAIDPASVTKDVIVVRELKIAAPDLIYEKGSGGSNVEAIQRNVDEYVKTHFGGGQPSKDKKDEASPAQRFIIENLQIGNGKVQLAGIAGKETDVTLPPVHLRDIGKSRGGMTGGEIASVIIKQMTEGIVASAARALAQEGVKRGKEAVKGRVLKR
jgi:hypothetical protein